MDYTGKRDHDVSFRISEEDLSKIKLMCSEIETTMKVAHGWNVRVSPSSFLDGLVKDALKKYQRRTA